MKAALHQKTARKVTMKNWDGEVKFLEIKQFEREQSGLNKIVGLHLGENS
jgi:hypothetical protein